MSPHFCGAVQICDLANSTYARLAQERSDWLQATAALSEADKVNCRKAAREGGLGHNPAAAVFSLAKNLFRQAKSGSIYEPLFYYSPAGKIFSLIPEAFIAF